MKVLVFFFDIYWVDCFGFLEIFGVRDDNNGDDS